MNRLWILPVLGTLMVTGCRQNESSIETGSLTLNFKYMVNGNPAVFNQDVYENAAGNTYEITNIQWFISDLSFVDNEGDTIPSSADDWIHYVDSGLPETMTWTLSQIKPDEYKGIVFVFGIRGEKNVSNMFTDPPESNMLWPYNMGGDFGGYHYMKLNGFWLNSSGQRTPFNCHLGVGQIYDQEGKITGYVQNWFKVYLPSSSFTMTSGGTVRANMNMNIENWFEKPFVFDWNIYGGTIMNNQEAMSKIRDNGNNVFTIDFISEEPGS